MAVDIRDYAHRHAFLFGVYEEDLTRLIVRISRPRWTVLDVGANAGYVSLLAADLGGPGSRVLAFEPNPRMVELLRRSAVLNRRAPLEIVEAACGGHDGQVSLSLSPDLHNTGLSTLAGELTDARRLSVEMVRLDRFCASRGLRPDLVKIDVEGTEAGVLLGAEGLLREGLPPFVVCELWPATRDDVVGYMADMGYTVHSIRSDGTLAPVGAVAGAPWENVCFRHQRAGPVV